MPSSPPMRFNLSFKDILSYDGEFLQTYEFTDIKLNSSIHFEEGKGESQ